jgi:hypothetical protein
VKVQDAGRCIPDAVIKDESRTPMMLNVNLAGIALQFYCAPWKDNYLQIAEGNMSVQFQTLSAIEQLRGT